MNVNTLLSTAAFGLALWFAHILHAENPLVEAFEHYQKQSFRNRYEILAANGRYSLIIPIDHGYNSAREIRAVKIAYTGQWQKIHLKAIISAYRNAPFFEFYFDAIENLLSRQLPSLFEFNQNATQICLNALKTKVSVNTSISYQPVESCGFNDLRSLIHPKRQQELGLTYHFPEYQQVFMERHGFQANLSILDVLFNLGPDSAYYLASISGKNLLEG